MKDRDPLLFIKIPFYAIPVILTILNLCTDWLYAEGVPLYWIFMGSWLLTWLIGLCAEWAGGRAERENFPAMPADKVGYMEWHDGPGCMGYYLVEDMDRMGLGATVHNYSMGTAELVQKLNRIIAVKKLAVSKLTVSAITGRDSEALRQKRNAGYDVTDNDINVVSDILTEQGYALVNVLGEGLNLCITIVTAQEEAELNMLEQS